jgi:hypothetical protein
MAPGYRTTRRIFSGAVFGAMLLLQACAGGYQTSRVNGSEKVYRIDEQGNKVLVYEVDRDGNTTVHKADDPTYQRHQAAQQHAERAKQMQAARVEHIRQASKRQHDDPIFVALHPIELDKNLKKSEHSKGAVDKQFRDEFKSDKVIRFVDNKDRKRNEWVEINQVAAGINPSREPLADVEVISRAYLKEMRGIDKKTGKPGKMPAIVFEATIKSSHLPQKYTVKEYGNMFRNVEVTRRFASQIKHIIKDQIGPSIPAPRQATR